MNKALQLGGAALALLAAGLVHAQSLSKGDQQILIDLAEANIAEVATATMALQKSHTPEVTSFAQQMKDDHTQGLQEVTKVATAKGVKLPTEPNAAHKKAADGLQKLSGAAFDKAYLANAGVKDHNEAHAKVSNARKSAQDADVKALASKLEPVIAEHLKTAKELNSSKR